MPTAWVRRKDDLIFPKKRHPRLIFPNPYPNLPFPIPISDAQRQRKPLHHVPPNDCHNDCDSLFSIVDDGDDCVMTSSFRSLSFAVRSQHVVARDDGRRRFIQIR
ncbi:unnamed protein product [Prunus brigantina]